jgi:2-polyprenyl-3-methyl-5-hydroxy-6-metoxy-1,4-benzoquinol methylase
VIQNDISSIFISDPLFATIKLSRYKFAAKMLSSEDQVLDLGCGKGYGAYFFSKFGKSSIGLDEVDSFDSGIIKSKTHNLELIKGDILAPPPQIDNRKFDAVVSLDVIEHFNLADGDKILKWCKRHIYDNGMVIIGTPNRHSQAYRSRINQHQHIYEYEPEELEKKIKENFERTFMFSMNDELVHTGFSKLAWFFFIIGVIPKK